MTIVFDGFKRRACAMAWAIALAAVALQPGAADAGVCKETTRDGKMSGAQLSFRNSTAEPLTIRFYRGTVSENQLKKTQTIEAGKRAQYNYGAHDWYVTVTPIAVLAFGGADVMRCSFQANNSRTSSGLGKTHWKEGSCVALDAAAETCPTCTTTCEKSYVSGKTRWDTQFTFTKPSGS